MAYNWEGTLVFDRIATHITVDGNRYTYSCTKNYIHKLVKCIASGCHHFYMTMRNQIIKNVLSVLDKYGWETLMCITDR